MIRTSGTTNLHSTQQQQSKQQADSVVLEEEFDPNYEPSPDEIGEYAEFLEMDPVADADLLWIAREGLKAPLPAAWKPCKTDSDEVYYFNFETGESVWEHPCDEYYKTLFQNEKAKKAQMKGVKSAGPAANGKQNNNNSGVLNNKTNTASNPLTANAANNKLAPVQLGGSLNKFKPLPSVNSLSEITPKAGYDIDHRRDDDEFDMAPSKQHESSANSKIQPQASKIPVSKTLTNTTSTTNLFNKPLLSSTNAKQQLNESEVSLDLSSDSHPINIDSPAAKQTVKPVEQPAVTTINKPKVTIIPSSKAAAVDAAANAQHDSDAEKLAKLKQIEVDKHAYIKQLDADFEAFKQKRRAEVDAQKHTIEQQHTAELAALNKSQSTKLFDKQSQLDTDTAAVEKLAAEQQQKKTTLQQQMNELSKIVDDNDAKLNKLKAEHVDAEQKLNDELEAAKHKHDAEMKSLEQHRTDVEKAVQSKRDTLQQLTAEVDRNSADLHSQHNKQLDDIKHKHKQVLVELHQHHTDQIDVLKAKHAAELSTINAELSQTVGDTGNAADQVKRLKSQLDELQHKFIDVQLARNTAEVQLRDAKMTHDKQIEALKSDLRTLQAQQSSAQHDDIRKLQTQVTDLTVELQHTQSERDGYSAQVDKMTADMSKQTSTTSNIDNTVIVQLKRQVDTLNKQAAVTQNELNNLRAKQSSFDSGDADEQQTQLIEQVDELQMQLASQTEDYHAQRNASNKTVERLQNQVDAATQELQQLRSNPFKLTAINGAAGEVVDSKPQAAESEHKTAQDDELMLHEIDDLDDAETHNNKHSKRQSKQRTHSTTRVSTDRQRVAWQHNHAALDASVNNSDSDALIVPHGKSRTQRQHSVYVSDVDSVSTRDLSELHFLSERKEKQRHRSRSHKQQRKSGGAYRDNHAGTSAVHSAWTNKVDVEQNILQQVRQYVSGHKQAIKGNMVSLNEQQVQWKMDKRRYNDKYGHVSTAESTDKQKKFVKLKTTKKQLDDQAKLLNNDIRQLRGVQQWLDRQEYKLVQFETQLQRMMNAMAMDGSDVDTSVELETNQTIELMWNEYVGDVHEYQSYVNSAPAATSSHHRFHTLQQPLTSMNDKYSNHALSSTMAHQRTHSAIPAGMMSHTLGNTVMAPTNSTYAADQPMTAQDRTDVQQRVNVLQSMLSRWSTTTSDVANKHHVDSHAQWLRQFNERVKSTGSIPATPIKQALSSTTGHTQAITIPKQTGQDKDIVIRITRE